ncbi:MAG: NTPase KAP, partial [Thermoleophilia bacterium]
LYAELPHSVEALCTPGEIGSPREGNEVLKEQVGRLIEAAGKEREAVAVAMIRLLFPFARRHIENNNYGPDWQRTFLRDRRLAHRSVLSLYLERVAGSDLAGDSAAEGAWERFTDGRALESYLREVPEERRLDTIRSLEAYEEEFAPEMVVPASTALLNVGDDLPDRPRELFGLDANLVVGRVVVKLLRVLPGKPEADGAVDLIYDGLRTLSAKYELLRIAGVAEDSERELVGEQAKVALGRRFSEDVAATPAKALVGERELARVIYRARLYADPEAPPIEIPPDPEVTMTMLASASTVQQSQTLGSHAVRLTPVFAWDALVDLYGSEQLLVERIEELKASEVEITGELKELIDRYLGGWRPPAFGAGDELPDNDGEN